MTRANRGRTATALLTTLTLLASLTLLVAPAAAATIVPLHDDHKGADSTTFNEEDDCGSFGNEGSGVVWHFVLNGLDANTPAGTLSATFTTAGTLAATGEPVGNGSVQHYFVLTPDDDVLEDASATVADQNSAPPHPMLVLSHVCHQTGGDTQDPQDPPDPNIDVTISKTASDGTVDQGDSFSYTLTARNIGDADATDVIVTDNLDNDLEIDGVSPSQGSCDPVAADNRITCDLGTLAPGASATVTINVTAPADDDDICGEVDNKASVSASNESSGTSGNNDSERIFVTVECEGTSPDPDPEPEGESCPSATTLLVTFSWNGSAFTPDGGNAQGVSVSGDATLAYYTSAQEIAGLVITAGGTSVNFALDFPETTGSVSAGDFDVFGGAPMQSIGFCVGDKTSPDSGSGVSIELSKDAECATLDNGTATVSGTITVTVHGSATIRIKTARDFILGPNDQALLRTNIDALIGVVLARADGPLTVAYEITFDPGQFEEFDNFIELTIENAVTGNDRHKYYNARAAFELCDEGEPPVDEPPVDEPPVDEPPVDEEEEQPPTREDELPGVGGPREGRLPDTAIESVIGSSLAAFLALLMAGSVGALGYAQVRARARRPS
ncbi:MAG: DUF11 domain-containing protein [Candidatus Limnocylindria bacterium]